MPAARSILAGAAAAGLLLAGQAMAQGAPAAATAGPIDRQIARGNDVLSIVPVQFYFTRAFDTEAGPAELAAGLAFDDSADSRELPRFPAAAPLLERHPDLKALAGPAAVERFAADDRELARLHARLALRRLPKRLLEAGESLADFLDAADRAAEDADPQERANLQKTAKVAQAAFAERYAGELARLRSMYGDFRAWFELANRTQLRLCALDVLADEGGAGPAAAAARALLAWDDNAVSITPKVVGGTAAHARDGGVDLAIAGVSAEQAGALERAFSGRECAFGEVRAR